MIKNEVIDLYKIRFEHFYNGVLTFDIPYCTYDCLFCFSRGDRQKYKENKEGGSLKEIKLKEFLFGEEIDKNIKKRIYLKNNSRNWVEFFDENFGLLDDNNNLIKKEYTGKIAIKTTVEDLIKKIPHLIELCSFPINSIRFTSGDIVNSKYLDWFNDFIEYFLNLDSNNQILLIETNGSRFSMENNDDYTFKRFIALIEKYKNNKKIHIRISLKNPNDAFYRVLTKYGNKDKLINAIDFGLFCYFHKIDFHYSLIANYLSIDDLIKFKNILIKKIGNNRNHVINTDSSFSSNEEIFNEIFKRIEFERLFYYNTIFKDYLIAYYLLKKDANLKPIFKKLNWIKYLNEMSSIYENEFNNRHKAYYIRYLHRTLPMFNDEFQVFESVLRQVKKINNTFNNYLKENHKDIQFTEKNQEIVFNGYMGILDFWEIAFGSRFLHYRPEKPNFSNKITFQDISLIDRFPLFPGLFYLYDFWAQSKPSSFIYALYSERRFLAIDNNRYYIFCLNSNPNTHAHTDISRGIPILIDKEEQNGKNIIKKIINEHVIDLKSINLDIKAIKNYKVEINDLSIDIPFYILKLNSISFNPNDSQKTPFLGNIGAIYRNKYVFNEFFTFLNYFIWTGIDYSNSINPSLKKALKYLNNYQIPRFNEEDLDWMELIILEPQSEILEFTDSEITKKMMNKEEFRRILIEISKNKNKILDALI